MISISSLNHIAIIASDYQRSLTFYREVLGFELISETWRAERRSMMAKLSLNGSYLLELFTFPDAPKRLSYPEALGLRHIAFTVPDLEEAVEDLCAHGFTPEPIREDPTTGERCFFCADPDGLPVEFVETLPAPLKGGK